MVSFHADLWSSSVLEPTGSTFCVRVPVALVHTNPCTVVSPDCSHRTFHAGKNEPPWALNRCFHVWFKEAPQHASFMGITFACTRTGFRVPLGCMAQLLPQSFLPEVVFRGKAAVKLYNLSSAIRCWYWSVGLKTTKKLGSDFYPGTVVEMVIWSLFLLLLTKPLLLILKNR